MGTIFLMILLCFRTASCDILYGSLENNLIDLHKLIGREEEPSNRVF